MTELTPEGTALVTQTARQHNVSEEAVRLLLIALVNGGGTQAQFTIPELGGMGQWSQGGMTMVGDMFNTRLKAQVDALCRDLAAALQAQGGLVAPRQSQTQSSADSVLAPAPQQPSPFFTPDPAAPQWPAHLGTPASEGRQNDLHYAWFPQARRLAIRRGGALTLHDTGAHRIGGAAQAQGAGQSLTFTSQLGTVTLADLPVVSDAGDSADSAPPASGTPDPATQALATQADATPTPDMASADSAETQIFDWIERLAGLHARGILSDAEFQAKKAELLSRL